MIMFKSFFKYKKGGSSGDVWMYVKFCRHWNEVDRFVKYETDHQRFNYKIVTDFDTGKILIYEKKRSMKRYNKRR